MLLGSLINFYWLGGILFSIFSVWNVLSSSFIAGHYIGQDFVFGLVSTLPHGIIEYMATVFALTMLSS